MTQIETYKGFTITDEAKTSITGYSFISAKRIVTDKLDELMLSTREYRLWASNTSDPELWKSQDLLKQVKEEIDRYHKDKLEILDDIITRISKGEQL